MSWVRVPSQRVLSIEPVESLSSEESALLSRFSSRQHEWEANPEPGFLTYWMEGGEVVAYRLDGGAVIIAPPNPKIEPGMEVIARKGAGHVSNSQLSVWFARELVEDRGGNAGMVIDQFEATRRAQEAIGPGYVVLTEETREEPFGWVFFYGSPDGATLAGNAPLVVLRDSGEVRETGTARSLEEYLSGLREEWHDRWR